MASGWVIAVEIKSLELKSQRDERTRWKPSRLKVKVKAKLAMRASKSFFGFARRFQMKNHLDASFLGLCDAQKRRKSQATLMMNERLEMLTLATADITSGSGLSGKGFPFTLARLPAGFSPFDFAIHRFLSFAPPPIHRINVFLRLKLLVGNAKSDLLFFVPSVPALSRLHLLRDDKREEEGRKAERKLLERERGAQQI